MLAQYGSMEKLRECNRGHLYDEKRKKLIIKIRKEHHLAVTVEP
jgi:hypothetical protein